MAYRCPRCGGEVDLAATPMESGLVRLAAIGAAGFALAFDDPALHGLAAEALGPCPHDGAPTWNADALRPIAARGWEALETAAPDDEALARLAALWRPRVLILLGRTGELTSEEVLRARLSERLDGVVAQMNAAEDEDERERLHARYIELGMVLAGRLRAAWA
jgi:hypothetical protein